ncbi:hypothetical protein CEXT_625291, partial [Caerostris extrusa]
MIGYASMNSELQEAKKENCSPGCCFTMDLRLAHSTSKSSATSKAEMNRRDAEDKELFSTLENTPSNLKQVAIDIETLVTELSKQKERKEETPESHLHNEREHRGTQTKHRLIPRTISRCYGCRR